MPIDATELRRLREAATTCLCGLPHCDGCRSMDEMTAILRASVPEILSALEDRDRLEWLEERVQRETVTFYRKEDESSEVTFYTNNFEMDADTLRAAIDAARGAK